MKKISIFLILFSFSFLSYAQLDRSKPPEPGPAPKINLGKVDSLTLANGLKVFIVEKHKLPRVAFSLVIDRDPIFEGEYAGYVSAAGDLLRGGTKTRTKDQLDKEIDQIGASFSTSSTGIFAMSLKEYSGKLLELIADVVINSDFKQEELDKIKLRMKSDLAASKDDPDAIAETVTNALIYGKDHPYGEIITEETIDNITLLKTQEYFNTYFIPNITYLAVVGDITTEEAKPLIEKYFGKWAGREPVKHEYKMPQPPSETRVAIVDRPASVQSTIIVSYPVDLKPNSGDVIKTTVMNTILGGGVFRLFNNLREKHGYTYGAYSTLRRDEVIGFFNASADVRNEVTDSAITEILYEMKRIRTEDVPEEELQMAKNYITGNFAMSLEEPQTIANFAINIDRYDLPKDFYENYLKNIQRVSINDVREAASGYLKPFRSHIIVVGNAEEIEEDLKAFGPVSYYDIYANEIDRAKLKIPEGLTGEKVIENYINSIGGEENLLKVNDRKTTMKGSMQGIDFFVSSYSKAPNKFYQEVNAGEIKQKVIFNGTEGVMITGENRTVIEGSELEKLKYEATLNLILNLDSAGITTELAGIEKVNGKDAYKVEIKFPSGSKWTQYYDAETGLKVKEIKPIITPQGTFNQETFYSDYREVEGVKYPFELRQSLGPQKMLFTIESVEVNSGISDRNFEIEE